MKVVGSQLLHHHEWLYGAINWERKFTSCYFLTIEGEIQMTSKKACTLAFNILAFLTLRNKSLCLVNYYSIIYCCNSKTPIEGFSFFLIGTMLPFLFQKLRVRFCLNPLLKDSTLILQNIFLPSIIYDILF